MTASLEISARHQACRGAGLDLGAPVGPEADAGSGGRVQAYEHGRIYWHRDTGAHEVHGAILDLYLREGGPGGHPDTGRRHLGYPVSGVERTADGLHGITRFELGDILDVAGAGCVAIADGFREVWHSHGGELGALLLPLCMPIAVAGGEAMFFERGCLWRGPVTDGAIITARFEPPLLGKPALIGRQAGDVRLRDFIRWDLPAPLAARLQSTDPDLLSRIWRDRLALRRVQAPGTGADALCPLLPDPVPAFPDQASARVDVAIAAEGPAPLRERGLYDLVVWLPDQPPFPAAPHSFYVKSAWQQFGFIHATDIHVAKRIEQLQASLAAKDPALAAAADHFVNFNDGLRDLVRYANHLHDLGLLDLILATGDLVDYAFEEDDLRDGHRGGNYAYFEALVRGRASARGRPGEELRVPIFTAFGNHDYRVNPYHLLFESAAARGLPRHTETMFAPYDLVEDEVHALQGGKLTGSPAFGLRMLQVDRANARGSYDYYRRRINREPSYAVALGDHRVVMIDAGPDAGIPARVLPFCLRFATGTLGAQTRQLLSGRPNVEGVDSEHLALLRSVLAEAPAGAMVVVGIHAPPINIRGSELAPWFRETQRASADRRQLVAFALRQEVARRGRLARHYNRLHPGGAAAIDAVIHGRSDARLPDTVWEGLTTLALRTLGRGRWVEDGGAHFASGPPDDLLADGVAAGATEAFLQLCTGADGARPVDLVLCGHAHDRVEYRVAWDREAQELRHFMDFYLENPATYYSCHEAGVDGRVHLRIRDGAALDGEAGQADDDGAAAPFRVRDIPPFAEPLDAAGSARDWWQRYRPLIVETGPLGPIDRSQRADHGVRPDPSFSGFRLFQVDGGVIAKGRYVTLAALRANGFVMPFEPKDR